MLTAATLIATTILEDTDAIRLWGSLGVGGAIAGLIFWFYRKDVQRYTELWKGQSEQLIQVVKENTTAMTANVEITKLMYEHLQHTARGDNGHPFSLPERREHPRG